MGDKIRKIFDTVIDIVFAVILVFLTVAVAIGAIQLTLNIWELVQFRGGNEYYFKMVSDVLTLFILVELSRSLADYFTLHRLRLTFIVDAAVIFVLREIMILLFKHEITANDFYGYAALLFVLGALRIGCVLVFQRETHMSKTIEKAAGQSPGH